MATKKGGKKMSSKKAGAGKGGMKAGGKKGPSAGGKKGPKAGSGK